MVEKQTAAVQVGQAGAHPLRDPMAAETANSKAAFSAAHPAGKERPFPEELEAVKKVGSGTGQVEVVAAVNHPPVATKEPLKVVGWVVLLFLPAQPQAPLSLEAAGQPRGPA